MADDQVIIPDLPLMPGIAEAIAAELLTPQNAGKVKALLQDVHLEQRKDEIELGAKSHEHLALEMFRIISKVMKILEVPGNAIARETIDEFLGGNLGAAVGNNDAGQRLLSRIAGNSGTVAPGADGAARYLSMMLTDQFAAWVRGVAVEVIGAALPDWFPFGGTVEAFAELEDIIADALGGPAMVRRVLQPYLDVTAITPLQWHVNKTYRPELLTPAAAVRQFHRGRWTREQLDEELARQGFSADRIEAFVNAGKKFFSASDVRTFTDRDHWPLDKGLQHLRDQGLDQDAAVDALRLEGLRRIEQLEASESTAILAAYVDRRINNSEFRSMLRAAVQSPEERALLEELADVRLATNIRRLSPAEVRTMVKAGIKSFVDYRRALEREGYPPEDVDALDLLLRVEIQERNDIEQARLEQAAERAAEKEKRELAAAARRAEIEADRARRRRGPISDLERAVIRGVIPFSRLQEVLEAEYDADTVEIMLALVEDDRQRYLAQQAAAEEARKRGARRDLDVGALERAVMAGLLSPEEFNGRLTFMKFDPADAALLTAVVRAKKADHDEAIQRRLEAEERARRRRIDLSRFERLVRRGARPMAAYDALLADLGFEDADRAAMRELVEIQIADDRKAEEERAAAAARLEPRGLSLEQMRRAVVLEISTEDDFQRFLIENDFTADAQAVLLAELRLAVAEADDARRRREQAATRAGSPGLSLATLQRAARLGFVQPQTYIDRLRVLGYDDDALAVELELLLFEIAEIQRVRAIREGGPPLPSPSATPRTEPPLEPGAPAVPTPEPRELTLAQVERAVRAGALTLDDYRVAAIGAGMASAAVEVVVAVLAQEVGTLTEAREVRAIVLRRLADRNVSLDELEAAVTKGGQPIDSFVAVLQQLGIDADAAELVAALLLDELEAAAAKGTGAGNG